jgi:hypothetical protein
MEMLSYPMNHLGEWFGSAVFGIFNAGGLSLVPFWVHGLSFKELRILAIAILPVVLALYFFALWREGRQLK